MYYVSRDNAAVLGFEAPIYLIKHNIYKTLYSMMTKYRILETNLYQNLPMICLTKIVSAAGVKYKLPRDTSFLFIFVPFEQHGECGKLKIVPKLPSTWSSCDVVMSLH